MADKDIARVNYFTGEFLNTEDFKREQKYNIDMLCYHNKSLHSAGIAAGLDVITDINDSNNIIITEGVAIDSDGNEIILTEKQVISLINLNGFLYYVTISYHEELAEYTNITGVQGYKRIIQKPKINLQLKLDHPNQDILLGVISLSPDHKLKQILYTHGQHQRKHAGIILGTASFYVNKIAPQDYPTITAKIDTHNHHWLAINANMTQFGGLVNIRNNFSITDKEQTLLSSFYVSALRISAQGLLRSNGAYISCQDNEANNIPFNPMPNVGDAIIVHIKADVPELVCTVIEIIDQTQVKVDPAPNPPLSAMKYMLVRNTVAQFCDQGYNNILTINNNATVGIKTSSPSKELEVNGTIKATTVESDYFVGDGSQLVGITGLWSRSPKDPQNIYYKAGRVAIGDDNPNATLQVVGTDAIVGTGIISTLQSDTSNTVHGIGTTKFTSELAVGDYIKVGCYSDDEKNKIPEQTIMVQEIISDNEIVTKEPFNPPLTDTKFHIQRPIAQFFVDETAVTHSTPTLTIIGSSVGIDTATPDPTCALDVMGNLNVSGTISAAGTHIGGDVECDNLKVDKTLQVIGNTECSSLNVSQALQVTGSVSILNGPYSIPNEFVAPTDGFVLGWITGSNGECTQFCLGWLIISVDNLQFNTAGGNFVPHDGWAATFPNTILLPVKKGQTVITTIQYGDQIEYEPAYSFFWYSIGSASNDLVDAVQDLNNIVNMASKNTQNNPKADIKKEKNIEEKINTLISVFGSILPQPLKDDQKEKLAIAIEDLFKE